MTEQLDEAITKARAELLRYLVDMKNFQNIEVREVLNRLSAYSARASEIRMRIVNKPEKRAQTFRTQEVDPFLAEVDRQFKIWSRILALMTTEYEINKGSM